jgi:polyphosphate:AMP phosphotransferase
MLESVDLTRTVDKKEFKESKDQLALRLSALQRQLTEQQVPLMIVFEGWDAAGKGTLINRLILPLDPRGFNVYSTLPPTEEERLRPFLRRFWVRSPARGRIAIFDRSWYRRVLNDRVDGTVRKADLEQAFQDIHAFERQLTDSGTILVKFFLHISRREQKKRFAKLRANESTRWRVTPEDLKRHKQYAKYAQAYEDMLAESESDFAPWTLVEAHDSRFATLKVFHTVIAALEQRLSPGPRPSRKAARPSVDTALPARLRVSILDRLDLTQTLDAAPYRDELERKQKELRELEHNIYVQRLPVVIVFEGCDAAGKGGSIRRLVAELDPRGYEVVPVAAPNDVEKAHHYLWRFWTQFPKAGHITIFDRSWYGRVLVERVEGFCVESDWRRAYREINEMERHMTHFGTVLVKFWLHIDLAEQLRRFKDREAEAHKRWKITPEDWRNRKKWPQYKTAIEEMLVRTSTPQAPWTVVESNCKRFARIKVLDTVIAAIRKNL